MEQREPNPEILPRVMFYVKRVACDYFVSNLENVQVKPLAGGYGTAANMRLEIAGSAYVLRVMSELVSPLKRDTELYAMKEAAVVGVAPFIHWMSHDGYAILMDYIAGGTITLEKGQKPEIALKIVDKMRKAHAIKKIPFYTPSFEAQMEEFYLQHSQEDSNKAIWDDAISIIKEGALQLQSLNAPTVSTHGDLNPRNILVSDQDIYFVDWGDGTYADPFQDLAFFSIMMDYSPEREAYLIQSYLNHSPTIDERKRFHIAKKMNFARLVLSGQGIGNQLSSGQKDDAAKSPLPPREWSYYARVFANENIPLSAQFFWGQAQVALESALT